MRGSLPAPGAKTRRYGGNTPCVEVRCGPRLIILDAGSGMRGLGDQLERSRRPVVADILLSHYHYDHLQGLPFFTPLFEPENRFTFFGARRQGRSVQDALEGQMVPPYFPVSLDQVAKARLDFRTVERGASFDLGEVRVRSAELDHPGGNFGYRLDYRGRSLVYATDVEHSEKPAENLVELARGADLLLHDAMYTGAEYPNRQGWGHSTWNGAVATARAAGVRRLVLFHHDPSRDDRGLDALVKTVRRQWPVTIAAREGQTLKLARGTRRG